MATSRGIGRPIETIRTVILSCAASVLLAPPRDGWTGHRGERNPGRQAGRGLLTGGVTVEASASPRVSVVVPVYNPGPGFDDLISSLDRQTLAPQDFEVLLCDDGSDDATRVHLDRVARNRPNVRVLHLEHTGWPGTPRNHGIQEARGTYVFFADQDDRLFEDGLEQLCDYADRNSSDVVVGKVVGVGRRIPGQIFRRDIPRAVLGKDPLLELLTPHKLFRTAFLRENAIRFPDGRVRLEDHLFVMQAYFRAERISILASRPCYAWINNAGSASSSRIDPESYFPHLESVLDLVEANVEPGARRDTLLRHWYRGKILKRMDGSRMVRYPDAYRERFLDTVTPIAQQRFGPGVERGLAFPLRIRSALLRQDRREDLLRLAEFEAGLECRTEVVSAQWLRRGKLHLTVRVDVLRDGQDALVFAEEPASEAGGADPAAIRPLRWQPPAELGEILPASELDARRDLRRDRLEVYIRDRESRTERRIAGRVAPDLHRVRITIDPLRTFARNDATASGDLVAHVRRAGWTFETPLRAEPALVEAMKPSPLLAGRRSRLVVAPDGTLGLRREWPAGRGRDLAARIVRRAGALARKVVPHRVRGVVAKALNYS
ncbi:glycosyltransferase family 2 protein [Microbacterium caowuchunii]|uniref:Glycosyltransferase family 2 protein n=1 Tax=Microbacterium caowuchunii TaxID=2614638 RepID=A0A5N0TJ35_9MICO|nr:glycosyltransferase family 2 protein [Microbacterium caowuchunii]